MEYNLQVRLNEAVNFWNHFLAHFDSGDLASIYNPQYLEKIAAAGRRPLLEKIQELEPLLLPYYQKLCFLPYFGLDSIGKLLNFLLDEDQFLNFVLNVQSDYRPQEVRILAGKIREVLVAEYEKFYQKYWRDNLPDFKERQKLVLAEISRIFPPALLYFSRVNPEVHLGEVDIFLVEVLGELGKGLGTMGCAIGLPEDKHDVVGKLLTGLHEIAHSFTDHLMDKFGFRAAGPPTLDNPEHLRREVVVNYLLEYFLINSGATLNETMPADQIKLIPIQVKKLIERKIPWGNLELHGIKTAAIGPTRSFMLLGKMLRWCPDFFVLEKKKQYFLAYAPLVNRLYYLDSVFSGKVGQGQLSPEDQKLFAGAQLLVPADKKLEPETPATLTEETIRIHLTSDCNLRCVYCYLASGEKKKKTDPSMIKKLIDKFTRPDQKSVKIEFHGGGEPTLEFKVIQEIVEYVQSKCQNPVFYLQTNGLFPPEILDFLRAHDFRLSFSIDGPPALNNIQRPTPEGNPKAQEIIERNIRASLKAGLKVMTVSVITAFNAPYLREIFWYLYHLGVRRMMFNPLTLLGRATKFRSLPTQPPDLHNFVRDFLRVAEIAEWLEVILISDFLPKFLKDHRPQELACSACAAELNLSEDGYLVACTRTLALGAPEGNPFIFGYFDRSTGDFILDETKISRLRGRTVLNMQNAKKISACENCLIKWDCSGDCLNELYLTNRDFYQVVPGRCREKLFFARNYLRYLAGREFIQIKPYLKKEAGQLFLVGYFNRFLLGDSKQTTDFRYNPYIKISLKKDPLKEIYHKILAYQKQFFSRPVLFLIEVEEDLSHRRIAAVLESFIRSLKQSGLIFRIVKPLSRVLSADFSRTYDIPETCFDCRALFSVEAGRVIFCDGQQGQNLEDYATRDQIFNEFSGINPGCLNLKV